MRKEITVLGAGTVGVCTALYLLRDGHQVTLIDRVSPGMGCSFGNGGLIQVGGCVPVATPGVLFNVPKMLLDRDQPLVIRWRHLLRLMPYLVRFVLSARPGRVEENSIALASLLSSAVASYAPLLQAANASGLVRNTGELYVYESDGSYRSALAAHELRRRRGVDVEFLEPDRIYEIEPALARIYRHGVFLPGSLKTADPYVFTKALADHFVQSGGRFVNAVAHDIQLGPQGPTQLRTSAGPFKVDNLVIATGAFSRKWAAALGSKVPLDTERGYHLMLPAPNVNLQVPIISGDYKFGMIPMDGGLRLAGTAELATLESPPDYERADRLLSLAQRALPGLAGAGGKRWMGHRPSMPDSVPVIGRSPKFPSVYFAFGHGHSGLTMGGVTGRIISDLVANREPCVDISPFSPARF